MVSHVETSDADIFSASAIVSKCLMVGMSGFAGEKGQNKRQLSTHGGHDGTHSLIQIRLRVLWVGPLI